MQNPREYWQQYVDRLGGPQKAAQRLGIPYSSIACICNGSRGIGRNLAQRMAAADAALDPAVLVWVTSEAAEKQVAGKAA